MFNDAYGLGPVVGAAVGAALGVAATFVGLVVTAVQRRRQSVKPDL